MINFKTTRDSPITMSPTETGFEIGYVENTPDGKVINVRVVQTEYTPFGTRVMDENKKFPIAMQSVITGYDVETQQPIFDMVTLKAIFKSFGINIV